MRSSLLLLTQDTTLDRPYVTKGTLWEYKTKHINNCVSQQTNNPFFIIYPTLRDVLKEITGKIISYPPISSPTPIPLSLALSLALFLSPYL